MPFELGKHRNLVPEPGVGRDHMGKHKSNDKKIDKNLRSKKF